MATRSLKFYSFLWLVGAVLVCAFASCGGDDDKDEPTQLTVSPSQISLMSDKNSSSSFTITSNGTWTVSVDDDWLMLSATSGTGNGAITLTAMSENASSADRTATVTVTAVDQVASVVVTQKAAYDANITVEFTDVLALCTSVGFHFNVGSKVDYFLFGTITTSLAGWTDDRIVEWLEEEETARVPADNAGNYFGFANMISGREYYLVAVGFDSKGNRGELTRQRVQIPEDEDGPFVWITDVKYSSTRWYMTYNPNGHTDMFYSAVWDGNKARNLGLYYCDAEVAMVMKKAIESGEIKPKPNLNKEWYVDRSNGAEFVYIATWGVGVREVFANKINTFFSSTSSNKPAMQAPVYDHDRPVKVIVSREDMESLRIITD